MPVKEGVAAAQAIPSAPATLESLYRSHYAAMVRLAYLLTGAEEAARDIVQDSFVKVHRAWARVEDPVPYLRRTVTNGCKSWHRRRAIEQRLPRPGGDDQAALGADELGDALARLPFRQQAALVLRFYEGRTEAEIAEALGCKQGTVGPLIHRGLEALRKVIER